MSHVRNDYHIWNSIFEIFIVWNAFVPLGSNYKCVCMCVHLHTCTRPHVNSISKGSLLKVANISSGSFIETLSPYIQNTINLIALITGKHKQAGILKN